MHPKVHTSTGGLSGVEEEGVLCFRGIPYAASTEGEGRFRAPMPVKPWSGFRDASQPGFAAIQPFRLPAAFRRFSTVPPIGISEDCLFLNVWTPALDHRPRPVMFWIHGGGFTRGSGSWYLYSGANLARRGDVVVVSINYRLGALGALMTDEMSDGHSADSNVGLRDQMAALQWVVKNISDFGGDPSKIVAFGQSAGAMSVASLIASPQSESLIQRAILQSGAARNYLEPDQAKSVSRNFCRYLEIDIESQSPLSELRKKTAEEILKAQLQVSANQRMPMGMMSWQPSLDGDILTKPPLEQWPGKKEQAPQILIGANLEEWKMFTATDGKRRNMDEATLRDYLSRTFVEAGGGLELTELALEYYQHSEEGKSRTPGQIWSAIQGDRVFHLPAVQLADRNSELGGQTWFYRFDWRSRRLKERVGACHSMELPFVFGTVQKPLPRWLLKAKPEDQTLSEHMQEVWLAFARTGDPRTEASPEWPFYQSQGGQARVLGGSKREVPALTRSLRNFWAHESGERGS